MSRRNRTLWVAVLAVMTVMGAAGTAQANDCPSPFKRIDINVDCEPSEDWVVIFSHTHEYRPGRASQVCWQSDALQADHELTIDPKFGNDDQFGAGYFRTINGDLPNKWVLSGNPSATGDFDYTITVTKKSDGSVLCEVDPGVIIRY